MRRGDLVPLLLIGGISTFVVVQLVRRPPAIPAPDRPAIEKTGSAAPAVRQQGRVGYTTAVDARPSREPAPERDEARVRDQIREGASGTYLLALLEQEERLLARWPDRRLNALRVWIERDAAIPGWQPSYAVVAGNAFEEWRLAGFPIAFDVVLDSTDADIAIRWVAQFPKSDDARIGSTNRKRDQHGWIVSAEVVIATHDRDGNALPAAVVAGAARHEVGHALGLGHSPSRGDVMYPLSTATVISAADRATLHLLYKLPPGVVK